MNCIYKDKVYYIHILMNGLCSVYEEKEKCEALGLCPEIYFKDICVFRDERIDEIFKVNYKNGVVYKEIKIRR